MNPIPTPTQKRICWAALTSLSAVAVVAVVCFTVFVAVRLMGFLQPVLLPLAVAGILAYLLEPLVAFFCKRGLNRTMGTLLVFLLFFAAATGVLLSVVPTAYKQGSMFVQNFPAFSAKFQSLGLKTLNQFQSWQQPLAEASPTPATDALPASDPEASAEDSQGDSQTHRFVNLFSRDNITRQTAVLLEQGMDWLQQSLPDLLLYIGRLLQRSLGGFLGAFGLIIGFILVPVFLFYLLRDAPRIKENWADFIPLPESPLKTEIASLILEINGYIVAFFRGQILVGIIDGAIIAVFLLIMGMEYAVLIGLLVATLGIVPYAGTILTWGPATLIAAAQFGDWLHPLLVTLLFIGVNQLDSLFITPYVLGESVGLHSLTVMIAVLAWTVVIGGLLGALLAVPLTASLKVLLRRYLWERPAVTASASPPGPS